MDNELLQAPIFPSINTSTMANNKLTSALRRGSVITFKGVECSSNSSANLPAFMRLQGQESNMSLRNNGSPKLGRKLLKGFYYSKELIMDGVHGLTQSSSFTKDSRTSLRHRKDQITGTSVLLQPAKRPLDVSLTNPSENCSRHMIRNVSTSELESMRGVSVTLANKQNDISRQQTLLSQGKEVASEDSTLPAAQNRKYVKRKLSTIQSSKEEEDSKEECEVPLLVEFAAEGQTQQHTSNRLPVKKWHSWGQITYEGQSSDSGQNVGLTQESRNNSMSLSNKSKATMSSDVKDSSLKQWISDLVKTGTKLETTNGDGQTEAAEKLRCPESGIGDRRKDEEDGLWNVVSDDLDFAGAIESRV